MTKNGKGIMIITLGIMMTALFGIMPPIVLGGLIGGVVGIITAMLGTILGIITGMVITREIYEMEVPDEG